MPLELAVTPDERPDGESARGPARIDAADWWEARRMCLSDLRRGLIEAYYFAGRTDAEIADLFGLGSGKRVKGRRHVALSMLRDMGP